MWTPSENNLATTNPCSTSSMADASSTKQDKVGGVSVISSHDSRLLAGIKELLELLSILGEGYRLSSVSILWFPIYSRTKGCNLCVTCGRFTPEGLQSQWKGDWSISDHTIEREAKKALEAWAKPKLVKTLYILVRSYQTCYQKQKVNMHALYMAPGL